MSAGPIGEAHVLISPDLRGFSAKLRTEMTAAIGRVKDPTVKIKFDLHKGSLRAAIAEANKILKAANVKAKIEFDLQRTSLTRSIAEAKRIAKGANVKVGVDVDRTKIQSASRDFQLLGRSGKSALRSLNQEVFHSNIRLREMANILGGATLPVLASLASVGVAAFTSLGAAAAGAAAAVAVLPGLIAAALQAVGVIALAFSGIGAAVKAMGAAQTSAGRDATSSARQQQAAADSIKAAQRGVRDALQGVRDAQLALNDARREARQQLADLRLEEVRLSLDQRGATLGIKEAEAELRDVLADPKATDLQRQRAKLRVEESRLARTEITRRIALNKAEIRSGVEGSDLVVSAKERQHAAAVQLTDAQTALAKAQRDAAVSSTAAAGGVDKLGQAMSKLSPASQRFARFLFSLKPKLDELRATAAAGFLPALEAGIGRLVNAHFPALRRIVEATSRTLGSLADAGSRLLSSGPWRRDFAAIGLQNVRLIDQFGRAGLNLADAFRNLIIAAAPLTRLIGDMTLKWSENVKGAAAAGRESGKLGRFFKEAGDALQSLLRIAGNVGATLGAIFTAAFPSGAGLLKSLEGATDKMRELATSTAGGTALRDFFDKARPAAETIGRLMVSLARSIFEVVVHLKTATERIGEFLDKHPEFAEMVAQAAALALALKALNIAGLAGVVASLGQLIVINPVLTLIVGGVLALGAAFVFAYTHNKPFKEAVDRLATTVKETVLPALKDFGAFIKDKVVPALKEAIPFIRDQLIAGLDFLFQAIEDNKPQLQTLGRLLLAVGKFILVTVIPAIAKLVAVHLRALFTSFGIIIGVIGLLTRVFKVMVSGILAGFQTMLDAAVSAFGWLPIIGPQLKKAQTKFHEFAKGVNDALDGVKSKNVIVTARGVFKAPKGIVQLPGGGGDFSTAGQRYGGGPITTGVRSRDSTWAMLRKDEHVWTPEEVDAAGGHGAIYALRRAILNGWRPLRFAAGGAVEDAGPGRFRATGRSSPSALEEGLGGFDRNVDRFALALGKSLGSQLNFGGSGKVSGVKFGGAAMSYIAKFLRDAGVAFQIISGFRAGARTRGTGSVSLHALGRALDLVGAGGTSMLDIWRAATKIPFKKEVIFSPAPFQVYGSGKHPGPPTNPKTRADHYNHVHVGLFDRGGWLMPGLTLAENRSGRPERVVPATRDHIGRLGFGGQGVTIQQLVVQPLAGRFRLADVLTELALQGVR